MELALLYLVHFLIEFGIHRIPIITLVTVAFQVVLFFGIGPPIIISNNYSDVTLSWYKVVSKQEYHRLFFGQMEHSSDFHLYHNVMSFVWKGYMIERAVGFRRFLSLMLVFISVVGVGTILGHYLLSWIFFNADYIYQEALGFQGVLFALKIVLNQLSPTDGMQYGQLMAAGSWFELILSSLFNKYSSWVGIAVGLAVGFEYTKGFVIKSIVDAIDGIIGLVLEMTGFAEDIERAAENWNERDDGQANPNAGRGGMFGMGMGGMGMGMGMGRGMGFGGPRYRARRW